MKSDDNLDRIKTAVETFEIKEPCGIDRMHKVKRAFKNEVWPAYFLFNREGKLKRRAGGKAGLIMIEAIFEKMFDK